MSAEVSLFICGRNVQKPECSTAACSNPASNRCTFELQGKAQGRTCDRQVCEPCAPNGMCPPHERMAAKARALL